MYIRVLGIISVLLFACNSGSKGGRFISENDTTFSRDIRDISKKINADPSNPVLYYNRGNAFFYQDKFSDAVLDLEYAVVLDSLNPVYHHKLGETLLKVDSADSRKARLHLETAVKLKPDFHEALLSLGRYYLARQEYDKAGELFKKLTATQEFADKAFLYLGIGSKETKDTATALVYFEKAVQVNAQNYEAAMQVALIKAQQNDPRTPDYFDRVIAINEFSDEAYYGKGLYLQKKEKYKDAIEHYEKARQLNPGHILATYNIAVIYNLFEDYFRAEEMCNKVLDLDEGNDNALALRGYTFEKRNNKKAAFEDYRAALKINAGNEPAKAGLKALGYGNESQ